VLSVIPEWREACLAVRVRRLRCFMAAAAVEEAAEAAAVLRAAAAELGSDELRADAHGNAVLATVEREAARMEAALDAGQQQALARRLNGQCKGILARVAERYADELEVYRKLG
jgi:hypothetical protein